MKRTTFVRNIAIQGLALLMLSSTLFAQRRIIVPAAGKWTYLGEANIDGKADHDRIKVGQSHGEFRRIQILVQDAAVDFDRVVVHYGNGTQYPVQIAAKINAGGKTREIDLPGDKRWIESVEVWYRRGSVFNGAKPKIRLMGIKW